jgi:hypothetical protein
LENTYTKPKIMKTSLFTFILLLIGTISFAQSADEKAIRTVIDEETTAFYKGNADKTLSYWLNAPYVAHSHTEKGSGYLRGYNTVSQAFKKVLKANPDLKKYVSKSHDFMIHVNGNSAWATYISELSNGKEKTQDYDARYLEKQGGVWKIVGAFETPAPK